MEEEDGEINSFLFHHRGPMNTSFEMNPRKNSEKFLRRFRGLVKKCQELGDITGFPVFFMVEKPKERHIFCNDDNFWAEYTGNGIQENVAGKRYKVINNQVDVVSCSLKIRPADRKRENQFANSQTVGRVVENVAELSKESTWMIDAKLSELMKCAAALQTPINTIDDTRPVAPIVIQPMPPGPPNTVTIEDDGPINQHQLNRIPIAASNTGEILSSLISTQGLKPSAYSHMVVASSNAPMMSDMSKPISEVKDGMEYHATNFDSHLTSFEGHVIRSDGRATSVSDKDLNDPSVKSTTGVDNTFSMSTTSAVNMAELPMVKEEKVNKQEADAYTGGILDLQQSSHERTNIPPAPTLMPLMQAGVQGLVKYESDDGVVEDQCKEVCTPQNLSNLDYNEEILNPIGSIGSIVQNPKFATSTSLELSQKFLQGSISPEKLQHLLDRVSNRLTDRSELICHICSREFTRKDRLNTHLLAHTREKKPFECTDCGKKFRQKLALTIHIRIHTGEKPYECSVCSKKFAQKVSLQTHMFSHTGEKPFQCTVCSRGFGQKNDLKKHMRTHTGEKPFQCSKCHQKFARKTNLQAHMMAHSGEKPFGCSVCNKKFLHKNDLKKHMRTHTGEKPFECAECHQKFAQKTNLQAHMMTHSGEKPFECSVCSKKFPHKSDLKKHMRTHTGEKPFECLECHQKFTQKTNLQTHMMIHSGDRPFECSICTKKFTKMNDLKKHTRTHTGEKPFCCSVCGVKFSQRGNLRKHNMRFHQDSESQEKS